MDYGIKSVIQSLLSIIIPTILLFGFYRVVISNSKKSKETKEEEEERVKNDTKDMDFWEACQYTANEKKKRMEKIKKALMYAMVIALILTIGICIKESTFKIGDILKGYFTVLIFVIIFGGIIFKTKIFGAYDPVDNLKELFYRDVWTPIFTEHNYHNIHIGEYGSINDRSIGLVKGDERKREKRSVECDEFKYNRIEYYHEVRNYDKDGTERTSESTTFNGFELFLPCNTGVNEAIRIVPSTTKIGGEKLDKTMSVKQQDGEEHIDIEDIEFNENFEVFSRDPHSAFYFLTSERIEKLKELRRKNPLSVVIQNDGIYVAVDKFQFFFEMPPISMLQKSSKETFETEFQRFEEMLNEYRKIL